MLPKLKKPTDNSAGCGKYSFDYAVKTEMQISYGVQVIFRFTAKFVLLVVQKRLLIELKNWLLKQFIYLIQKNI